MSDTISKHHPASPNGHDDICNNLSNNQPFDAVLSHRLSRRQVLKGGFGLAATTLMSGGLAGCLGGGSSGSGSSPFALNFTAVPKSLADTISVPSGYTATAIYRLGDPLTAATSDYANNGSDTAASFTSRAGDCHDGMHYFGLNNAGTAKDLSNANRGLLVMNHEYINQPFLHTAAEVSAGFTATARVASQIDKEVNAHGVSIVEVSKANGSYSTSKSSNFNRRITAATVMDIAGPAAGSTLMQTKFSPTGSQTRGTVNNCANGYTPWGTYLTCEENWAGYFKRGSDTVTRSSGETTALSRYGVTSSNGNYGWANPSGGDTSGTDLYNRWNVAKTNSSPALDFANVANTMGWVVEIDPFAPTSTPRKRTALGRFAHEGAMPAKVSAGKPIVYYMGDDSRGEYIYKFVSSQNWDANDANGGLAAGDKYLNSGKLYVAKFAADGSGSWLELNLSALGSASNYSLPARLMSLSMPAWQPTHWEPHRWIAPNGLASILKQATSTLR